MCGIYGYTGGKNNAAQIVLEGLKKLEYRGYDSWGIAVWSGGKIVIEKHIGKIGDARTILPSSQIAIGHTRWATHGGVLEKNAHPFFDCQKKIALLHNGIIENYQELKKELTKRGHIFNSDTDSEVAVHLVEENLKTQHFVEAVRQTFLRLKGLNAIVVLNGPKKEIIAVKNGSPLVVGVATGENFVSSDAPALLGATRNVIFLRDDEMVILKDTSVKLKNVQTGENKHLQIEYLDWKIEETEKGRYRHFMLKEIFEQPKIIRNIINNKTQAVILAHRIKKAFGTYFIGCGTAFHACLFAQYLFSRVAKTHVNATMGSEFSYLTDFLTPKSLVIALSQSGETADIIESVGNAQRKNAHVIAIVNNLGSTLYRIANDKILLGAGPEKAVASTKAFISKLTICILISYAMIGNLKKGRRILIATANEVEKLLEEENIKNIKRIAKKILSAKNIFIIGRGQSYPIALEAALKIKEISYIHAEGFAAGELKHGVIALVEKDTPCIIFAPNDETYGAVISGAMEMKARGGLIIGISFKENEVFDEYINIRDCQEGSSITGVVTAQLLAYYLAVAKKLDPDKPRNLAKSVTVK